MHSIHTCCSENKQALKHILICNYAISQELINNFFNFKEKKRRKENYSVFFRNSVKILVTFLKFSRFPRQDSGVFVEFDRLLIEPIKTAGWGFRTIKKAREFKNLGRNLLFLDSRSFCCCWYVEVAETDPSLSFHLTFSLVFFFFVLHISVIKFLLLIAVVSRVWDIPAWILGFALPAKVLKDPVRLTSREVWASSI